MDPKQVFLITSALEDHEKFDLILAPIFGANSNISKK